MSSTLEQRIKSLGWVPDIPDIRDLYLSVPRPVLGKLPSKINLRSKCPPVYDQSTIGSCTSNAIGGAIQFDRMKQHLDNWNPCRLFIYYNERVIENTVSTDAGAMIRDGVKAVNKLGVCDENLWPYDVTKFTIKPPSQAYDQARLHQAVKYQRVPRDLNQFKGSLVSGYPIVIGFAVYESFMTERVAETGTMPMPLTTEKQIGGHAVLIVGYDDSIQRFIVRNSWSEGWGDNGYFTMPYEYIVNQNLSDDFWMISLVL